MGQATQHGNHDSSTYSVCLHNYLPTCPACKRNTGINDENNLDPDDVRVHLVDVVLPRFTGSITGGTVPVWLCSACGFVFIGRTETANTALMDLGVEYCAPITTMNSDTIIHTIDENTVMVKSSEGTYSLEHYINGKVIHATGGNNSDVLDLQIRLRDIENKVTTLGEDVRIAKDDACFAIRQRTSNFELR